MKKPTTIYWDHVAKEALAYRKKHFAVEVKPAENPLQDGEVFLRVTHNGYEWSGISMLKSEVAQVIKALQQA